MQACLPERETERDSDTHINRCIFEAQQIFTRLAAVVCRGGLRVGSDVGKSQFHT